MGVFLLLPMLVGLYYHEKVWFYYMIVAVCCIALGTINSFRKPKDNVFYLKEGCVVTGLSWILLSAIGALPLFLSGEIPNYIDALFETVSGFTTTGASILDNVEGLSHAALFWRSATHLVGGMGVLVFLLAVIPLSGGSNINLMRAESPGPSVGKLMPKIRHTARILYIIYLGMTVLEFALLAIGGMSVFDAINTAMATAGTGGFGIYNDSITSFSVYSQWIITIFMAAFGINFNFYYFLLFGHIREAFNMEEVKYYLAMLAASILVITLNIANSCADLFEALTQAAFQVSSIATTTGFSTADFAQWPQVSRCVLVLLMFVGACAGSTGGGFKVSRIVILAKNIKKELHSYIHPRSVRKLSMDDKLIAPDVIKSTTIYLSTFVFVFFVSVFIVSFENLDFGTTCTAVLATLNNIGPGMELVGPTCNFGFFTPFTKIILMLDMLAGRLELYPILMLFHPTLYKQFFQRKNIKHQE